MRRVGEALDPGRTASVPGVLAKAAQADIDERWRYYRQLAGLERSVTTDGEDSP